MTARATVNNYYRYNAANEQHIIKPAEIYANIASVFDPMWITDDALKNPEEIMAITEKFINKAHIRTQALLQDRLSAFKTSPELKSELKYEPLHTNIKVMLDTNDYLLAFRLYVAHLADAKTDEKTGLHHAAGIVKKFLQNYDDIDARITAHIDLIDNPMFVPVYKFYIRLKSKYDYDLKTLESIIGKHQLVFDSTSHENILTELNQGNTIESILAMNLAYDSIPPISNISQSAPEVFKTQPKLKPNSILDEKANTTLIDNLLVVLPAASREHAINTHPSLKTRAQPVLEKIRTIIEQLSPHKNEPRIRAFLDSDTNDLFFVMLHQELQKNGWNILKIDIGKQSKKGSAGTLFAVPRRYITFTKQNITPASEQSKEIEITITQQGIKNSNVTAPTPATVSKK